MANNRIFLKCTKCKSPDNVILIAKYYPSKNWRFQNGDSKNDFNDFFDKHRHIGDDNYGFLLGGTNFILEFEQDEQFN